MDQKFFIQLQGLVDGSQIIIDRPKGSAHPLYPDYIYPYDYGHIDSTTSSDGRDIDCWVGSIGTTDITAIIATYDPIKKDMEMSILISCNDDQMDEILNCHKRGDMSVILIKKEF